LSSVPRWESVGGETRVDKGKVGRVKSMVEIVVVVVDLDRGELTFVDDVGRGKGADVEAFCDTPKIS
jgi:hypothetical protein